MEFVPIILVSFISALFLTPLARWVARRFGVMDQPSGRKVHTTATPLMGGLAIYGAMAVALLTLSTWDYQRELLAIGAGATVMALVGLIDDRYGMGFRIKLLMQIVAGIMHAWQRSGLEFGAPPEPVGVDDETPSAQDGAPTEDVEMPLTRDEVRPHDEVTGL